MMKIIHLSDLHFGTEREKPLAALIQDIIESQADLVVISGDLTQRARPNQYEAAKSFIDQIKVPVLTVPGNHDIPLYNLFARLFFPFKNYKHWIADSLCRYLIIKNVVILGINSATPYKPMGGYITRAQLKKVTDFFSSQPKDKIKIVVMHHNLIHSERHKIINDSEKIISLFAKSDISLVLSGHIHLPYIELLKRNYLSHNMYVITAGTAISTRTIVPNSYNIIEVQEKGFQFIVRDFDKDQFVSISEQFYPFHR